MGNGNLTKVGWNPPWLDPYDINQSYIVKDQMLSRLWRSHNGFQLFEDF